MSECVRTGGALLPWGRPVALLGGSDVDVHRTGDGGHEARGGSGPFARGTGCAFAAVVPVSGRTRTRRRSGARLWAVTGASPRARPSVVRFGPVTPAAWQDRGSNESARRLSGGSAHGQGGACL